MSLPDELSMQLRDSEAVKGQSVFFSLFHAEERTAARLLLNDNRSCEEESELADSSFNKH